MPRTSRKEASTQRAQDKESKRARGAMSCAGRAPFPLKMRRDNDTRDCEVLQSEIFSKFPPNTSIVHTGRGGRNSKHKGDGALGYAGERGKQ
jgi:hypothetical protein